MYVVRCRCLEMVKACQTKTHIPCSQILKARVHCSSNSKQPLKSRPYWDQDQMQGMRLQAWTRN